MKKRAHNLIPYKEELGEVKNIKYIIHGTLADFRIVSPSRSGNLECTVIIWGEFLLPVDAEMKNSEKEHAGLWIDLGFEQIRE